jgi:hypothetical protein
MIKSLEDILLFKTGKEHPENGNSVAERPMRYDECGTPAVIMEPRDGR